MFFSSRVCHGLEPMRKVGGTPLNGPDLDSVSNSVSRHLVQRLVALELLHEALNHAQVRPP